MLHDTGREPRRGSIHDLLKADAKIRGVSPSFVSAGRVQESHTVGWHYCEIIRLTPSPKSLTNRDVVLRPVERHATVEDGQRPRSRPAGNR